jgi:leader peptidase (prepilin peptidase)/N-methyltransferase
MDNVIDLITKNPNIFLMLIAALSLLVGSFLNVVIYRLPRMIESEWNQECREYLGLKPHSDEPKPLNLYLPFSHCPHCNFKALAQYSHH